MVELEEGGGSAAPRLVGHLHQQLPAQVYNNIKQCSLCRPTSSPASCTEEEVSSILAMSTRPAPCGSPAATIASAMRGSSASPGILTGCKAMEEFFGLGMEGPEDDGGEGNLGRVEKNTKRAESNVAPPRPGETSTRESESAKVRVNGLFFRVSGRS